MSLMRDVAGYVAFCLLAGLWLSLIVACGFWDQRPVCPPSDPQCFEPRPWEVFTPQPGAARDSGHD